MEYLLPVMIIKTKNRKYLLLEEFDMSVQDVNLTSIDMTINNGIISEANSYYSKATTGGVLFTSHASLTVFLVNSTHNIFTL